MSTQDGPRTETTAAYPNALGHDAASGPDQAAQQVQRFASGDGRWIYRLPLEVFPGFHGNAYLICGGDKPLLVDCGSGQSSSNRDLTQGLEQVAALFGETVQWGDLGAVLLTHGHIDHYGGLSFVRDRCSAPVAIHVLDHGVVTDHSERLALGARQMEHFFRRAGVRAVRRQSYLEMFGVTERFYQSQPVDFLVPEGMLLDGELEAYPAPGHSPGQVCLRVGEVLLTADHLLARISPHLAPESITPGTGVWHYFESLDRIGALSGVALGLGGHQEAMPSIAARAREIREELQQRHRRMLELCAEPRSMLELSQQLFGQVASFHVPLAILETGAHVEYLHQRGELGIVNAGELDSEAEVAEIYSS